MSDVHTVASEGFNIGQAYHLARPSYPVEAMRLIQAAIDKNGRPLEVVEHGAGSGLFTQLLTAPPEGYPTIPLARLTAIEPSASMRQAFDAAVLPGAEERGVNVRCLSGTFTAFPEEVADGTVDSVIIAQAFHWAHPHYDGAMAAIARALKPDGVAVFVWNMEREAGAPWVRKLRAAYQEHEAGSPQYRLRLWEAAFSTQTYTSAFAPPEYSTFQYKLRCSRSLAIERAFSKSYVSRLPDNEKATLRAELERVLDEGEGMERIDPPEGSDGDDSWFSYPYETEVVVMRKTA